MPEIGDGNALCPVASFEKYLSKLHPENTMLWQRCRESFLSEDAVWYTKACVGTKKLSSFMSDMRKALTLPVNYSNHSIRATGATLLSRANLNAAQIMSVTGHKSVSSLSVYQRVSDSEKLTMGRAISSVVADQKHAEAEMLDLEDINFDDVSEWFPMAAQARPAPTRTMPSSSRLPNAPLFSNCNIGNVTINIMQ